jgi:hypothetical protein
MVRFGWHGLCSYRHKRGVTTLKNRTETASPVGFAEWGVLSTGARIVMSEERQGRVTYVIGPDGSPLTIADLPPPNTKRWVIRRKAEVVAAVRGGLLSLEEACNRYTLTVEEFLAWQRAIDKYGLAGLRTTRVQQYRN